MSSKRKNVKDGNVDIFSLIDDSKKGDTTLIKIPVSELKKIKEIIPEVEEVQAEDDFSDINIENCRSKKVERFVSTNDKISNDITKGLSDKLVNEDKKLSEYVVGKTNKPVITYVSIDIDRYDKNIEMRGVEPITEFDRLVHDAVTSLYRAGNYIITPPMINSVMSGRDKIKATQERIESIRESVERMRRTRLYIDYTNEEEMLGKEVKKRTLNSNLLSCDELEVKLNNEVVNAYKLLRQPILFEYANRKKQIISTPINLLNAPINNTPDVMVLKAYMIRRIEQMKNPNNKLSNAILYETIYKQIGKIEASKQIKSKIKKQIKVLLDYFKETGFIKEYKESKRGKIFHSIKIIL